MKNKFKAPIVEVKELSIINNIMEGGMLISTNTSIKGLTPVVDDVNEGYKIWKGLK